MANQQEEEKWRRENHEVVSAWATGTFTDEQERVIAEQITLDFLETHGRGFRHQMKSREGLEGEIVAAIEDIRKIKNEAERKKTEERFDYLIHGGRKVYVEEIERIKQDDNLDQEGKAEAARKLLADYQEAQLIELMAKTVSIDEIVTHIQNQYATASPLETMERTRTSYDPIKKEWVCEWDPNISPEGNPQSMGEVLSVETVERIREGIAQYFKMKDNSAKLVDGLDLRDPSSAKKILERAFGREVKLNGRARATIGPISITILVDSQDDYKSLLPGQLEQSGGAHFSILGERQVNVVRATSWGASLERTIAHENCHTLNEILLHGNRRVPAEDIADSTLAYLKIGEINSEISDDVSGHLFNECLQEALRGILQIFGDEALAYMLDTEYDAAATTVALSGDLYQHLNLENFTRDISTTLQNYINSTLSILEPRLKDRPGLIENIREDVNDQAAAFNQVSIARIKIIEKEMLRAIEQLKKSRVRIGRRTVDEFPAATLKALLSGVNPMQWPALAQRLTGESRSFTNHSLKEVGYRKIGYPEGIYSHDLRPLAQSMEKDLPLDERDILKLAESDVEGAIVRIVKLTPALLEIIRKTSLDALDLVSLESLSEEEAKIIALSPAKSLNIELKELPDACLKPLLKFETLELNISHISEGQAEILAQHSGHLKLGSTAMSAQAARLLARHKGPLEIYDLSQKEDGVVENLSFLEGKLSLGSQWHHFQDLSEEEVRALAKNHEGELELGIKDLSLEVARQLSEHKGELRLEHVRSMDDDVIGVLAKHQGSLILSNLDSVSDNAVQILAGRKFDDGYGYNLRKQVEDYKKQIQNKE